MSTPSLPPFGDTEFLHSHVRFILDFYDPVVFDPAGGFFQTFRDDGSVYDPPLRHLVSSTRFIYNYANAFRLYGDQKHREWAEHGLTHLLEHHRQKNGHFAWVLQGHQVEDSSALCYGHAFVMLAAASAVQAGIDSARPLIAETWDFLEQHFWDQKHGAYADERDGSLQTLSPYRGQNANMHTCEALLAAWVAVGEIRYLDRAEQLAQRFAVELAAKSDGLIWEHYDTNWELDMQYNIDKPDDLFKPWGFQPGHQVEWSKLLLELHRHRPNAAWPKRAAELFDSAMKNGWDTEHGGLVYGFAPDGSFCDTHKYFWVHAEAFAAAMRLFHATGESRYLDDYQRIWEWAWQYLIDHEQGAWFRIRNRDGSVFDNLKSPPGKTDYHTMGACWDCIATIELNT